MDTEGFAEFLDDQQFSGVVRVTRGTQALVETATGEASPRWGVANALDTRFDTAGITKLFTSAAILQQVSKGNLDLETSIHHYVDLENTAIPIGVTLLHLLTHTSGIADDADEEAGESYAEIFRSTPSYTLTTAQDFLPLFAHKKPYDEPGVESHYSNAGYILAGLALEKVTGMPYRQYVFDEVFGPAGMLDSGFYDRREAAPRVAEGWDKNIDGQWVSNIFSFAPIGAPDAGAHSTAADLQKFFEAIRSGVLLDTEFTDEYLSPQVEHDEETSYGFGLEFDLNEDGTVRSYFKDGINPGASGIVRHYLEQELDVVVLSNSEDGAWDVITELDDRIEEL